MDLLTKKRMAVFFLPAQKNTFGQGVWNLETAPVVYCTNAETNWKSELKKETAEEYKDAYRYTQLFAPVESPFGGWWNIDGRSEVQLCFKPWHGLVCFFDPSSVKVSLNPQVFKSREIEGAKVTAACGVRKGNSFSRYDQYRTAQSLQNAMHHINTNTYQFPNRPTNDAPFNAYGRGVHQFSADPVDNQFSANSADKYEVGYIGGGDSDYQIEPIGLRAQADQNWGDYYPCLPTR